jgi:hypothetical protein
VRPQKAAILPSASLFPAGVRRGERPGSGCAEGINPSHAVPVGRSPTLPKTECGKGCLLATRRPHCGRAQPYLSTETILHGCMVATVVEVARARGRSGAALITQVSCNGRFASSQTGRLSYATSRPLAQPQPLGAPVTPYVLHLALHHLAVVAGAVDEVTVARVDADMIPML